MAFSAPKNDKDNLNNLTGMALKATKYTSGDLENDNLNNRSKGMSYYASKIPAQHTAAGGGPQEWWVLLMMMEMVMIMTIMVMMMMTIMIYNHIDDDGDVDDNDRESD